MTRGGEFASQTKQNHYFVASEHVPAAAKGGKGTAQGFIRANIGLFIFGPYERNKIKILLRLRYMYDIIKVSQAIYGLPEVFQ